MGKNPNINAVLEKMSSGQAFATGPAAETLKEANALYDAKDFAAAIAKYQEILAEWPDLYQIHLNVGNCYREQADYEKALIARNLV